MILCTAADQDLNTLIAWIKNKEACRRWAGPAVRFPLTLERLKQDIGYSAGNTFAMKAAGGELVGLGQLLDKGHNRIHLARIIVAPNQRGRGLGDRLCRLLIDKGLQRSGDVYFTLNVYSDNANAVKLYQKLGFEAHQAPTDSIPDEEILPMVLKTDPNVNIT